jgi:hypothetical protein
MGQSLGVAAIVLAGDLPELNHLPKDMCIEVDAPEPIAVRKAQCPTFYLVNLKNGQVLPMALDGATSYDFAESINEGIRRGLESLIRVSPDQ